MKITVKMINASIRKFWQNLCSSNSSRGLFLLSCNIINYQRKKKLQTNSLCKQNYVVEICRLKQESVHAKFQGIIFLKLVTFLQNDHASDIETQMIFSLFFNTTLGTLGRTANITAT